MCKAAPLGYINQKSNAIIEISIKNFNSFANFNDGCEIQSRYVFVAFIEMLFYTLNKYFTE